MATREKYDLTKIGDALLTGLDTMAKTPPPPKVRTGSKRAVLTQDRVRDRIRALLDHGYTPDMIADVCMAAGMSILGKTITQYCRTPDGEPVRRPTRRGKRSRRKSAAAKAATGIAASAESNPDTARPPATEPSVSGTTLPTAATSTDPNYELRRTLVSDSETDRARRRRSKFIGED